MTNPSIADNDPPRRSRARRRESMINATATVLGCMALVVMIATVVRVVMVKLWESAKVNPEYVQSVYDSDMERHWSGSTNQQAALLAENEAQAPKSGTKTDTDVVPPHSTAPAMNTAPPAASPEKRPASLLTLGASSSSIQDIESKRQKIEAAIRGFFEADAVGTKLSFVRDPQRVRPLMENFYRSHPLERHEWKSLGWILPVEEPGYRLGYAQAVFGDAEPVSLIIEELADGSFRMDWESSVRYGEISWGEFIQTQPASPKLFRVIASKPRHTPATEAPHGSEILEIKHPEEDDVIYAYFDRQDPKFHPLLQQLQTGNWKDVPLTLRLCYPGPAGSGKSVRIADVEGKGWLILQGTRS
ncbi:MAG TPA: hypothetical protein DDZ88_11870 [Verrucomicrobiales bacterium]|nr:hypothetical protein [Verrucomicrobiales bacterium]